MYNCHHDDLIHFHHNKCCHHSHEHRLKKVENKINTIYKQFELIDRVEFRNNYETITTLENYKIIDMEYGNGLYVAATDENKIKLSKDGINFDSATANPEVDGASIHKILFIGNSFLLIFNGDDKTAVYHTFDFNSYINIYLKDNQKINDGVFDETNNHIYLVGRNDKEYSFEHPEVKEVQKYKLGLVLSCDGNDLYTWKNYGYDDITGNVKNNFTNVELDSIVISRHGLVVAGHYINNIGDLIHYGTTEARLHISYSINGDEWCWGLHGLWNDYYYGTDGFYQKIFKLFNDNNLGQFDTTTNRLTLSYNDGVIIANDICGNIFSFDSLADDTFLYIMAKDWMWNTLTLGCVVNIDDIYLLMRHNYYKQNGEDKIYTSIEHSSKHTIYDYHDINHENGGGDKWGTLMGGKDNDLLNEITHIKRLNNRLYVFGNQHQYMFDSYIVEQILKFQYDEMIRKYPLGSIYVAKDSNPNYALLLGGWREYFKDQVLPDETINGNDHIICIRCI